MTTPQGGIRCGSWGVRSPAQVEVGRCPARPSMRGHTTNNILAPPAGVNVQPHYGGCSRRRGWDWVRRRWSRIAPAGKGRMAAVVRPRIFVCITVWAAVAPEGCSSVLTFSPDCPIGGLVLRRGICQALLAIKVGAMLRAPRWRIVEGVNFACDRRHVDVDRVLEHGTNPALRGSIL